MSTQATGAADRIAPEARALMRAEIEAAGGAEVSFFGRVDAAGVLVEAVVAARGHEGAVPALVRRCEGWDVAVHNHPSGLLLPSDADLAVAAAMAERGCEGFYIVSNDLERVYVVVPPHDPRRAPPLSPEVVDAFFAAEGPLARVLGEGYEPRPGQVRMAHQVAAALVEEGIAALESGTGTGKTFAYLVPSALHAVAQREKVVVSTATLNLQSQVVGKDVPTLLRALDDASLRVAVVKGRGNYVSLRRAAEAAAMDPIAFASEGERREVLRLVEWAKTTAQGDRAELDPPPSAEAWEHVASQADNCLGASCPRFGECRYYDARRRAARAHVLVVNHHLLFADLAIKRETGWERAAALPPFARVVLDEAHHLEAIAGDYFGLQVGERGLALALGRLRRKGSALRGLLPALLRELSATEGCERLTRATEAVLSLRDRAAADLRRSFAEATDAVRAILPPADARAEEARLRLAPDGLSVLAPLGDAQEAIAILAARLARLSEELDGALGNAGGERLRALVLQARAVSRRLARGASALEQLLAPYDPLEEVRWVEVRRRRRGRPRLVVRAAPLDVGPLLRAALWDRARTAVLSSATLTVGGRFDYLLRRLGLEGCERVRTDRIPSPFDYARQALLGVPEDMPLPDERNYEERLCAAVRQLVLATRGRAFVLFTSYGALRRAHDALAADLGAAGLVSLRQGEASREALLERFRSLPGAVLFGTDSFWEGVDVPGEDLVLVVIARLPFAVPSEPLQQARAEAVARAGGNPFYELQLPAAVLKLTQGFGRLVRTANDRGAVVVLDRRLLVRRYGRAFFDSLPEVRVEVAPLDELVDCVRRAVD